LDLTVAENLAVFRSIAPTPCSAAPDVLAAELGLEGRLDVRAGSLSGGERRRLELARALTASPRALLCDEPFAAIDPLGATRVAARLRALAAAGAAVIIADHHVAEALRLCHRAALLLEGEVALVAEPGAFAADPLVRKHYVGLPERGPQA
jgi:lipopolysaccharide export system ATP-binding protein